MNKRNTGMDIMRICAMIMVWICHSGFFSIGMTYPVLSFSGVLCVELFFTLSGLLVGKRLIHTVTSMSQKRELVKFYINRAFRILPLYYGILLFTSFMNKTAVPLSCLVFLHNYSDDALGFLPPAWSLSIEVWFYFLVPPVFCLLYKIFAHRFSEGTSVFLSVCTIALIPYLLRIITVMVYDPVWDYGIRKQPHLRLDSIMIGVFFAALKRYHEQWYQKISRNPLSLVISLGGIILIYRYYVAHDSSFEHSPFWKINLFFLLPLLCILLLLYMENTNIFHKYLPTMLQKTICLLGSIGYSAYLIHWFVFERVSTYFIDTSFSISWIGFLIAIALTLIFAILLFMLEEKTTLKLCHHILDNINNASLSA